MSRGIVRGTIGRVVVETGFRVKNRFLHSSPECERLKCPELYTGHWVPVNRTIWRRRDRNGRHTTRVSSTTWEIWSSVTYYRSGVISRTQTLGSSPPSSTVENDNVSYWWTSQKRRVIRRRWSWQVVETYYEHLELRFLGRGIRSSLCIGPCLWDVSWVLTVLLDMVFFLPESLPLYRMSEQSKVPTLHRHEYFPRTCSQRRLVGRGKQRVECI